MEILGASRAIFILMKVLVSGSSSTMRADML
jgi:hypothetical protein